MQLYRFSPIRNEAQLREAGAYIAEQSAALCRKIIGESLPFTYLTICTHYEDEYRLLSELLPMIGTVQDARNGIRVTLDRPIETVGQQISNLRLRKPDPYRMQVGCGDFLVEDYQTFKQSNLPSHPHNLRIIKRPEYEMIEFHDPDFDVLAYAVG